MITSLLKKPVLYGPLVTGNTFY